MINYGDEKASNRSAETSRVIQRCPRSELLGRIRQVEEAVLRGTAQMQDYETFVCCKEELKRREILLSDYRPDYSGASKH